MSQPSIYKLTDPNEKKRHASSTSITKVPDQSTKRKITRRLYYKQVHLIAIINLNTREVIKCKNIHPKQKKVR